MNVAVFSRLRLTCSDRVIPIDKYKRVQYGKAISKQNTDVRHTCARSYGRPRFAYRFHITLRVHTAAEPFARAEAGPSEKQRKKKPNENKHKSLRTELQPATECRPNGLQTEQHVRAR